MSSVPAADFYAPLPPSIAQHASTAAATALGMGSAEAHFKAHIHRNPLLPPPSSAAGGKAANLASRVYEERVRGKPVLLTAPVPSAADAQKRRHKRRLVRSEAKKVGMTAKERRRERVYEVPKEAQKFEMFVGLNDMWKQYMGELIGPGAANAGVVAEKLLKADYHGCHITVVRSLCEKYIGLSGIVAQETRNTFRLITVQDRMICVPKQHSVFKFQVQNHEYHLYGDQFRVRAAERAVRKWKPPSSVDMLRPSCVPDHILAALTE